MYLIDLDGTLYSGSVLLDGAIEFITYLQKEQLPFVLLTNNASRTKKQNADHITSLGFTGITEENFYTSAMAACKYVAMHYQERKAAYVGMDGLQEALLDNGFDIVQEHPDFVFVGLHKEGTYAMYSTALTHLLQGAILVGTNHDRVLPHDGAYQLGNGSIVSMLEYASGQTSLKIGKPYAPIVEMLCIDYNIKAEDCIMIGDNLETDILLGRNTDVKTIFVTSGVHTLEDSERLGIQADQNITNLRELIK